ncbi:hypothetical protein B0H17DRAFT_1211152 [Mycena rosella]|uniref:Uncharacterized protein n=1 Tax=Mycena rosella TaxID=1033263 RepID=A0AAD7G3U7_MYCRO|nr:hypothetical protein B0H17DRAFT_1211152 [Mycena rosella]
MSPSPEIESLQDQYVREVAAEDADLERAYHLSLEDMEAGPSLRLTSPSPVEQAQRLAVQLRSLRALSLSPNLPHSSALLDTLALGRAAAPDATGEPTLPRTRLAAASVPKQLRPPPLRITKQLNDTWMAANGGPQIAGPSTAVAGCTQSTLHIRTSIACRGFVDRQYVQHFMLVYFDRDDELATMVDVDECPDWPAYTFDKEMLVRLGTNIFDLERFSPEHGLWIWMNIHYVHVVSTDGVLVLRRRGICGFDEDTTLSTVFPKTKPPHIRYNIAKECSALCSQYKKSKGMVIVVSDNEASDSASEVEFVLHKRMIKQEKGASPPRQRPAYHN